MVLLTERSYHSEKKLQGKPDQWQGGREENNKEVKGDLWWPLVVETKELLGILKERET